MIIGIDLGTTNSLAAYFTEDGPKIIPNRLGKNLTPSIVSVDDTIIASTLNPSLTSVVHSKEYLAKAVADAMISIITGKSEWPFTKTFEPSLKIRKSCKQI